MEPFKEQGTNSVNTKFELSEPVSGTIISKDYVAGVDIKLLSDFIKRKTFIYISCADWSAQDGSILINHENRPSNLGQQQDTDYFKPWSDQTERVPAETILTENIIQSISVDDIRNMKDSVLSVFKQSPLSYFTREEIPYSARGLKASNQSIAGVSQISKNEVPFYDFEPDFLQQQSFSISDSVYTVIPFHDKLNTIEISNISITIEDEDFSRYEIRKSGGFTYSKAQSNTDSIAFGGLYRWQNFLVLL